MPMAVLDGPHFARRSFARRLRCGLELNLVRHDGLDLRCGARNGRSGLLGREQRPEIKISSSRSQDRTTSQGQRDDQTERSSLL